MNLHPRHLFSKTALSTRTPSTTKKVKQKPRIIKNFMRFLIVLQSFQQVFSYFICNASSLSVLSSRFCRRSASRRDLLSFIRNASLLSLLIFSALLPPVLVDARVAKHVRVFGDVMLYGLFPVHQRAPPTPTSTVTYNQHDDEQQTQNASGDYNISYYGQNSNSSRSADGDDVNCQRHEAAASCDTLDFVGIYLLEAALFAIDRAAAIMPEGVTLGADFSDTCTSPEYALHHARHYARLARAHNAETQQQRGAGHEPLGLGVVGPAHDDGLERTAELLSQFSVPQIAYWATTPSFADKSRFPYMFRSIPDARYEATAVLDLLKQLGWNVVHIVYAQDGFYRSLAVELDRMAAGRQICVGSLLPGPSEAEFKEDENNRIAQRVVRSVTKSKLNVNVVLWLGKAWDLQYMLRAMNETGLKGKIQLVGLSAWGDDRASLNDYQHLAEGALTLKMPTPAPPDFQAYFSYLKPTINPRNPWFMEFWENYFRCHFVHGDPTFIREGYQICTNNEDYSPILEYDLDESAANYVIDAVLAFAHAFKAMHYDKCRTFPGVCPLMRPFNLTEFTFNYLRNVSFDTLTSFASGSSNGNGISAALTPPSAFTPFSFHHGSNDRAEAHFQILNFQRDLSSSNSKDGKARFKLEHVGNWYSRAAVRRNQTTTKDTKNSHDNNQQNEQLRGRIFLDRFRLQTLTVQSILCPQACQTCSEFVRPKVEQRPSQPPPTPPPPKVRGTPFHSTEAKAGNQSSSHPVAEELDAADEAASGANRITAANVKLKSPAVMLLFLFASVTTYRSAIIL